MQVEYSLEPEPLETGGGLLHALPLLGDAPFLLINGDVWTEYPLTTLLEKQLLDHQAGHLVLVSNPDFHPEGDFALSSDGVLVDDPLIPRHTFAGISILRPELIQDYPQRRQRFPLGEVLRYAIARRQLTAEIFCGGWSDVGTPARLQALTQSLTSAHQVSMLKS